MKRHFGIRFFWERKPQEPAHKNAEVPEGLLFYSKGLLFLINQSYTEYAYSASHVINTIQTGVRNLEKYAPGKAGEVCTFVIKGSSRYEGKRIFYVPTNVVPKEAYNIGPDWSMWKWIEK